MSFDESQLVSPLAVPRFESFAPDLFVLSDGSDIVAYAPRRNFAFRTNEAGVAVMRNALDKPEVLAKLQAHEPFNSVCMLAPPSEPSLDIERPFELYNLTLSLTTACNLRCTYCYAFGGEQKQTMPRELAFLAVDEAIKSARRAEREFFSITFHGGGEPLMTWNVLIATVKYATAQADRHSLKVHFSIVTNGTLVSPNRAQVMAEHGFNVAVSVDGTESIQNQQRPTSNGSGSFSAVCDGLRNLAREGVPTSIRCTVTGQNVGHMIELLEWARSHSVRSVQLEPVALTGRASKNTLPVDPHEFVVNYSRALCWAQTRNMEVMMSLDHIGNPRCRFCGADGNISCVLPDGHVSSCTRVTRSDDDLSGEFFSGLLDPTRKRLTIDSDRVAKLRRLVVQEFGQCDECFCRWTCAGGCHHSRLLNGGVASTSTCTTARLLHWWRLKQAVPPLKGANLVETMSF